MAEENKWAGMAEDFDRKVHYVVGKQIMQAIQSELGALSDMGRVLELGCGTGIYSTVLAGKADDLCATDVSEEMVAMCRERMKNLSNARVEAQNCFSLTYPDSSFDAVIMVNLLHVVPEPEKALKESKRALKSKGQIVVVSFTMEGMGLFQKIAMAYRYFKAFGKPPESSQKLTVEKTCYMLEKEGFTIEESRLLGDVSAAVFVRATAN